MTTDNDFVAEKLGLCNEIWPYGKHAPDLLANPWILVEALWKRGIWAQPSFDGDLDLCEYSLDLNGDDRLSWATIIDGNLAAALLEAAAEMLRKDDKP